MDLVATLAAHRNHLIAAFRGPDWDAVATAYGAVGDSREAQLQGALEAVVTWARRLTADPEVLTHLDGFVRETLDEVAPKTGAVAGLAMIFANATAHTGWWAARYAAKTTDVADCDGCGAPQLRVLHFECEYCGEPLYPEAR